MIDEVRWSARCKGAVSLFWVFFCFFVFCSNVFLYVSTVTFQVLETGCSSTWRYHPSYSASYLHFMFCDCLFDFSPRSLPMIVTPYGHVLYIKMLQIASQFVSAILLRNGGGLRVLFCARARNHMWLLTSRSSRMRRKKDNGVFRGRLQL